jgi:DNA primase
VLWAVNVRRPLPKNVEDDKYKLVKGSRRKGGLYWVDHLRLGTTVMFVEGEFDCLLAWQEAKDLVSPVTLGAATNRLHSRWYGDLIYSPQILVVEDADRAGETMGLRLGTLSQRVQRIQVPIGKDLSDYHASQRFHTFRTWVEQQLLPSTTSTTSIPANSLITSTDLQQQNLFDLNPKTSTKSYYERGG